MQTQLDTEDWKEFRRELQEKRSIRREHVTTFVSKFCVTFSINIEKLTEYHFRLTREGFLPLDVFPTSFKVRIVKKGEKFKRVNLAQYLVKHFSIDLR